MSQSNVRLLRTDGHNIHDINVKAGNCEKRDTFSPAEWKKEERN